MITLFLETFLVEYYFLTILEGGGGVGVGTDKEIFTMQEIWVICSKLKYLWKVLGDKEWCNSFFLFFSLSHQPGWYIILETKNHFVLVWFFCFNHISILEILKNCKVDLFRWFVAITAFPSQDFESFLQNMSIINFGLLSIHPSQAHTIRTSDNMLRNPRVFCQLTFKEAPEGKQVLLPSLPQIPLLFPSLNQ